MKKVIAILIVAMLLTMPVLAGFEEEANANNIKYTIGAYTVKPVLDGKLDGEGAYTKIEYQPGDISYAWNDVFEEAEAWAKGHEFEIYASYDANNIYVMIITDANHYFNDLDDADGNAWQKSAIQVSIAAGTDTGTDRLEYGIWRKSDDGAQGGVIWAQHPSANAEHEPVAGTNYTVALDGGKLGYEMIIPVNTFLAKDSVAEGEIIGLNLVMAQTDPDSQGHIHTQFASGCTGDPGKDAERFAKITLGAPIVVAAPEPEPEPEPVVDDTAQGGGEENVHPEPVTTPAPVAPPTSDSGIAIFAVMMILAGAVIYGKKVSVK